MKPKIHQLSVNVNTTLSDRLRDVAKRVGSVSELARKSGVPDQTIRNYITRGSGPPADVLEKLAVAAGVSTTWLISGAGPREREEALTEEERIERLARAVQTVVRRHKKEVSIERALEIATAYRGLEKELGHKPRPEDLAEIESGAAAPNGSAGFDERAMRAAIRATLTTHPDAAPEWTAEHAVFLYSHLAGMRQHGELPRGEKAILDAALRAARAGAFQARGAHLEVEILALAIWAVETFLARRRVTASAETRARCIAEIYAAILDEPEPRKDSESKLQERAIRLAEAAIRNIKLSV